MTASGLFATVISFGLALSKLSNVPVIYIHPQGCSYTVVHHNDTPKGTGGYLAHCAEGQSLQAGRCSKTPLPVTHPPEYYPITV